MRITVEDASRPAFVFAFVTTFVAIRVATHGSRPTVGLLIFGSAVAASIVWQVVGLRRWGQWAIRQEADLSLVLELAEDARLVGGPHTWLGRRQRRKWLRLPRAQVRSN